VTSLAVTLLPPARTGQALVTWSRPADADNSSWPLIGYVLSYHVIGVGDCNSSYWQPVTSLPPLPADATNHVLDGLEAWLHYRVTVRALNDAGPGQQADTDFIMTGQCK